jgi:hypothetical protein
VSARMVWEPTPIRRHKSGKSVSTIRPHSVSVVSSSPAILSVVFDCGTAEPVTISEMTRDVALILRDRLDRKLNQPSGSTT